MTSVDTDPTSVQGPVISYTERMLRDSGVNFVLLVSRGKDDIAIIYDSDDTLLKAVAAIKDAVSKISKNTV